jgi:segregation and condensation protein A
MPARTIEAGSSANGRVGVLPRPEAMPEIAFQDGLAEPATHVKLNEFDGPLAMLLALIEARQLDVLTVPLGSLAEAYLDALATLEGDRLANVAAFVAISAQLILIKSRAILPRPPRTAAVPLDEEPDPEAELRARLLEYKRFRDAAMALGTRPVAERLFRRDADVAALAGRAGAIPPERPPLPPSALTTALGRLARTIVEAPMPTEIVARTITITERTAVIREALSGADVVILQDLLRGVRDRVVVAITFLAMLELAKRREITVEQAEPWGPIIARRLVPADGVARAEATTEIDESLESFA